jgi:hypothetical protein
LSLLRFCQWLEGTSGSISLHESIWAYPIIESVHVLTLCIFLGLTIVLDLRLLGVTFLDAPVSQLVKRLTPWTIGGFAIMVVTGALLFYAIPVKTYLNIFFRLKVMFLLMAGLNVAVFQFTISRTMKAWDYDAAPPFRARLAGGVSLALWACIVISGRLIAYNWFDKDPVSFVR